jgi:glycosyltransferase involved in cell wall biosynthesis
MEFEVGDKQMLIICVGQLKESKGYGQLINAASHIEADYKIVILGSGPLKDEWQNLIGSKGLGNRIRLAGSVDSDTVAKYFAAADWFVHPAMYDPSPLVAIEAVSAGIPVAISKQTGNNPETVKDGLNGYSFDSEVLEDVVKVLEKMIHTPERERINMAAASRQIAIERFSPESAIKRFYDEIGKL